MKTFTLGLDMLMVVTASKWCRNAIFIYFLHFLGKHAATASCGPCCKLSRFLIKSMTGLTSISLTGREWGSTAHDLKENSQTIFTNSIVSGMDKTCFKYPGL